MYSTQFGSVLSPWVSSVPVTKCHPDFQYPQLRTTAGNIKREHRLQFFDTSHNTVRALALKSGSEEAEKLFDSNDLDLFPTMDQGYKHHNTFFHGTSTAPWEILFLDKDYILVIPKRYGPFRKKKWNNLSLEQKLEGKEGKEEMSGLDYYNGLSPRATADLDANNLCPCLVPAFVIAGICDSAIASSIYNNTHG